MKRQKNTVVGIHPVGELLQATHKIEKIFIINHPNERLKQILQIARSKNIPTSLVPKVKLDRLSSRAHQGIVALTSLIDYVDCEEMIIRFYEEGKLPFIVVIDSVTDVRNIGSVARAAEAMGVDLLLIGTRNRALIQEEAIKASAGGLLHLPVSRTENLSKRLHYFQKSGIQNIALTEKAKQPIEKSDLRLPLALILGSEHTGIQKNIQKTVSSACQIAMKGKVKSLNVATAAAIAMYEVVRQNHGL